MNIVEYISTLPLEKRNILCRSRRLLLAKCIGTASSSIPFGWRLLFIWQASYMFTYPCGATGELSDNPYLIRHIWIPDAILFALLLILESVHKYKPLLSEFSIILGSHLCGIVFILNLSSEYHVKPLIMLLPLLVSMIYLRENYLRASSVICLIYIIMLFLNTSITDYTLRIQNIIITLILAGTSLAGFGVIARGKDLMRSLENSVKSEQELRIQNIIMDRLSKIDPLTDLYNHKTFHEYLGWLIDHQESNPFRCSWLLLISTISKRSMTSTDTGSETSFSGRSPLLCSSISTPMISQPGTAGRNS